MRRMPLHTLHEARGAEWMEYHGWAVPRCFSAVEQEYLALQEGVGLLDLSYRSKLRITGRDRRSWLHGQCTQDIENLPDGRGAYALILNPQGRLVTDLRVFAVPDALWVDTPPGTSVPVHEYLERYVVMERVRLEDATESWALLSLQGPLASCVVGALWGREMLDLRLWDVREAEFEEVPVLLARAPHCGEDGFDIFAPASAAAPLWAALSQHRREFAVHSVGWEALNIRRVEAGIPWWRAELDETVVPLEARLDHAISRTKGCYVGQEIIARIDARGQVKSLLAGFFVHGETLPERGAAIRRNGQAVGRVCTALRSLRLGRPIALGYLHRDLQEPGTRVTAETPAGRIELEVTSLPFVPHDYPAERA